MRAWSDPGVPLWVRGFFAAAGGALVVAALSAAAKPQLSALRSKSSQLLRDHLALRSAMRQVTKARGRRDAGLARAGDSELGLRLWRAREAASPDGAQALEREKGLRAAQSAIGQETSVEEERAALDARLRPLERLDTAAGGALAALLCAAALCLLCAWRLSLLGRAALPVPDPDLAGWRRWADNAGRLAAGAAWGWAPLAGGAALALALRASAAEPGGSLVAWLAALGLGAILGGFFVPREVSSLFSRRDWAGPKALGALARLLPSPGEAPSPDPEGSARLVFGLACLAAWLGCGAAVAAGLDSVFDGPLVAPLAAAGLAAAALALLPLCAFVLRSERARDGWPLLALGAFATLALAALPQAARLACGPAIESQRRAREEVSSLLDKSKAMSARLPKLELEFKALDDKVRGFPVDAEARAVLVAWQARGLTASDRKVLERLDPNTRAQAGNLFSGIARLARQIQEARDALARLPAMEEEAKRRSEEVSRWEKRAGVLGWLAIAMLLLSARFAWLCRRACHAGEGPDLGAGTVFGAMRWLWGCALLAPFGSGWAWTAATAWLLVPLQLWGSPGSWLSAFAMLRPRGRPEPVTFRAALGVGCLLGWLVLAAIVSALELSALAAPSGIVLAFLGWVLAGKALGSSKALLASLPGAGKRRTAFRAAALEAELPLLTRYLAAAARRGLPLDEAVRAHAGTLGRLPYQKRLRRLLEELAARLAAGGSLARAIDSVEADGGGPCFPPFYVALLRSGEAAGKVPEALGLALASVEGQEDLLAKTRSALFFVGISAAVVGMVALFMLVFVAPTFKSIFDGFGADLPLLTRWVLDGSGALGVLAPFALVAVQFAALSGGHRRRRPLLLVPGAAGILGRIGERDLCRGLALSLSAGYPADKALELAAGAVSGLAGEAAVRGAPERVRRGESLSKALGASAGLSRELLWACELGEHRGDLPDTFRWLGGYLAGSAAYRLELWTQLLERGLTLALGLAVCLILVALFAPLFQLGGLAGGF